MKTTYQYGQFMAPKGFGAFRKNVRYYFLGAAEGGVSHFAWFNRGPHGWRVHLISPSTEQVGGLLYGKKPKLIPINPPYTLPPYLQYAEGWNFDERESLRKRSPAPKFTYRQQGNGRLHVIQPAVKIEMQIVSARDPARLLNHFAYEAGSSVHPERFAASFFAYCLHNRNIWALKPPTERVGKWDRSAPCFEETKFGAPSADEETCFNSPSSPHAETIKAFFKDKFKEARTIKRVYDQFQKSQGCVEVKDAFHNSTYTNPSNGPILSEGQFRYQVAKQFGRGQVRSRKGGASRERAERGYNQGNFTGQYSRVLEGFEADGFQVEERPKRPYSDKPGLPLIVVRGICTTTSFRAGVGFAFGSEVKEAYNAMLFYCFASSSYLEKIYELPAGHLSELPGVGGPAVMGTDRGPGGSPTLFDGDDARLAIKSVMPSYEPKSKALMESTNPRNVKTFGAPAYSQSKYEVHQLIKKVLYDTREDNLKSDISARLSEKQTADFLDEGRVASPKHYVEYLVERGATAARYMSLEQAVRAFWVATEFEVDKDGVVYRTRRFSSEKFMRSGVMQSLPASGRLKIRGYYLSAVFRYVWVEIRGVLVELEVKPRTRTSPEELSVPKHFVDDDAEGRRRLRSRSRRNASAVVGETHRMFEEATGLALVPPTRKQGRPKRATGLDAHEDRILKGKRSSRRRCHR